jgi:hypothetical protein
MTVLLAPLIAAFWWFGRRGQVAGQ